MLFEVLICAFVVIMVSLIGVIFVQKTAREFLENKLSFLISFSAGVFLITAGALALEVFEIASSLWLGVVLISIGYILAWGVHALLPETHHHHDSDCSKGQGGVKKLIIGDAIHNIADGLVLVTAFSVSSAVGLAVVVSIIVHESLLSISKFFVLKQAGYSTKKALTINFAVSGTIIIGVLLGYFALATEGLEMILLAISTGFFLHVVIHDLLPKRSRHETGANFGKHVLLVIIGALLMGLIAGSLSEEHSHSQEKVVSGNEAVLYDPHNP